MIRSHDNNISRISPSWRLKNPNYIIKRISSYSVFVKVLIIALLNSFVHISQPAMDHFSSIMPQSNLTFWLWYSWAFRNRVTIGNDSAASMSTSEKNKLFLSLLCCNAYSNVVFLILVRSHDNNISQISTS